MYEKPFIPKTKGEKQKVRLGNKWSKKKIALCISVVATIIIIAVAGALLLPELLKTPEQSTDDDYKTPEQAYDDVYDWLVDNGKLSNNNQTIEYSASKGSNYKYYVYAYDYEDKYLRAEIRIPNKHANGGKSYTCTVGLNLVPYDDGTVSFSVTLDSNTNRAFCTNTYSIDIDKFKENSPLTSTGVICSNNTSAFPQYTDEEKAESLDLVDIIDDISYDYLLDLLNWLDGSFCPKVSLTMADFGYILYVSQKNTN